MSMLKWYSSEDGYIVKVQGGIWISNTSFPDYKPDAQLIVEVRPWKVDVSSISFVKMEAGLT